MATSTTTNTSCAVALIRFISTAASLPPVAYVAVTGHSPEWVRVWFAAWLGFWFLVTAASAAVLNSKS
jgi:hypothetical protein